jgi:hypothetical protein
MNESADSYPTCSRTSNHCSKEDIAYPLMERLCFLLLTYFYILLQNMAISQRFAGERRFLRESKNYWILFVLIAI